jgi:hypothetical protein
LDVVFMLGSPIFVNKICSVLKGTSTNLYDSGRSVGEGS